MGDLLEGLQLRAAAGVVELDQVGLGLAARLLAVDQRAQPAAHDDGLPLLVGHQLLRTEEGGGVDPLQPVGLELQARAQRGVLAGGDPVQQGVLLPVDHGRVDVEDQVGDVGGHLVQVVAAGALVRDPEGFVDRRRHDHRALGAGDLQDRQQGDDQREGQSGHGQAERRVAPAQVLQVGAESGVVHGGGSGSADHAAEVRRWRGAHRRQRAGRQVPPQPVDGEGRVLVGLDARQPAAEV